MGQLRDRNAVLMPNEIEAIKVTQEVIKRMADNSAKTKTLHPPQPRQGRTAGLETETPPKWRGLNS